MYKLITNPRLYVAAPLASIPEWGRVAMTVSCRDTERIAKVYGAGGVFLRPDGTRVQRMHNGLEVLAGGYHGEWMSEVIRQLQGHHEPQEELLFHSVVSFPGAVRTDPVMIELGAFWSYYSLWFRLIHPRARNILVEPDPGALSVGCRNFALNGFECEHLEAASGVHNAEIPFLCESDRVTRQVRTISIDGLLPELGLERVDLLHADIQGAELSMLSGAEQSIRDGRLNWLFVSTHHHSISGDPLTHPRCLEWLRDHGATIIDEHSVSESYSGDGLIVAVFGQPPRGMTLPPITRNVPSRSLFRETEYDLAEMAEENARLRQEIERLRVAKAAPSDRAEDTTPR